MPRSHILPYSFFLGFWRWPLRRKCFGTASRRHTTFCCFRFILSSGCLVSRCCQIRSRKIFLFHLPRFNTSWHTLHVQVLVIRCSCHCLARGASAWLTLASSVSSHSAVSSSSFSLFVCLSFFLSHDFRECRLVASGFVFGLIRSSTLRLAVNQLAQEPPSLIPFRGSTFGPRLLVSQLAQDPASLVFPVIRVRTLFTVIPGSLVLPLILVLALFRAVSQLPHDSLA